MRRLLCICGWGSWWIWLSLAVLILTAVAMVVRGAGYFNELRKAAGADYYGKGDEGQPAPVPLSSEEVVKLIKPSRATEMTAIGAVGLLILLWLTLLKPF